MAIMTGVQIIQPNNVPTIDNKDEKSKNWLSKKIKQ